MERGAPSVAGALLGTDASFRKSKPEKHFCIGFPLLKFLRQVSLQKETYLSQVSVGGEVGLPVLG